MPPGQTYSLTGLISETSPLVLDWNGENQNDPLAIMLRDTAFTMGASETEEIPFAPIPQPAPAIDLIDDTPRLAFSGYSNATNRVTRFWQDANFSTRLVFRPPGGVWISLGEVNWSLHGERTSQGGFYTEPSNWAGAENYNGPTGGDWTMSPELLPAWNENSQKYLTEWENKKP